MGANDFVDFVSNLDVMKLVLAIVLAKWGSDLANSVTDGLVMPVIDRVLELVHIKHLEKSDGVDILGARLKPGKIIVVFIKFAMVLFVLYLAMRVVPGLLDKDYIPRDMRVAEDHHHQAVSTVLRESTREQ